VQRAFTTIELLICLALSALLLRLAVPGFVDLLAGQRAVAASNAIIGVIALARSTAMRHQSVVVLCPDNENRCGRQRHWSTGALIFADANGNRQYDPEETLLGTLPAFDRGASVIWRSFRNRSYLVFNPSGLTDWQNGHFQYCPANGDVRFARQIILNAAGRTRVAPDRDGDGIREDARGRPLNCA
jgi:type IV fimbrial biogenesis protein FimT